MPVKHGPKGMVGKVAKFAIVIWCSDLDDDRPVAVKCAADEFGHPNTDYDGRTMYANTHFRTEREAWESLLANVTAHQSGSVNRYEQAKFALEEATKELAEAAAQAVRTRGNFEVWEQEAMRTFFSEGEPSSEDSST